MTRPLILLTNDDGYNAPGLEALAASLGELGRVVVVAPERERSAVSHTISLHKPLRVKEVRPDWYWCSGSPADSVYIALNHILDQTPVMVASGINSAHNVGDDVIYSGTVAGAREASMMGIDRSVAFSCDARKCSYEGAAANAARICKLILEQPPLADAFINVNFPSDTAADTPWQLTALGKRNYGRKVTQSTDPRGKPYYWIGGEFLGFDDIPGSD